MGKSLETVNRFFDLTSPKGRAMSSLLPQISELLTEDFVFSGPLMRIEGREKYLGLLSQFLGAHLSFEVIRQFENGDEVCSINELTVKAPSGNHVKMQMAEWFKLKNGSIFEHNIYYDPREFSKEFGV